MDAKILLCCEVCGKQFYRYASAVVGKHTYCSHKCQGKPPTTKNLPTICKANRGSFSKTNFPSKESRLKASQTKKRQYREGNSSAIENFKLGHTKEANVKRSMKMRGRDNPRYGKSWNKGLTKKDHPAIQRQAKSMKITRANDDSGYHTSEYKKHMRKITSLGGKARWNKRSEKERLQWLKDMGKAREKRPTNPELIMIQIINEFDLPYKYVGNGDFWIKNMNPDFINVNEQKIVLEVFGDYWHNLPEVKVLDGKKLDLLKSFGWDRVIIWEKDLVNGLSENIAEAIKEAENALFE